MLADLVVVNLMLANLVVKGPWGPPFEGAA